MRLANSTSVVDRRHFPEPGGNPAQENNLLFYATVQWISYALPDNEFVQYQFAPGTPRPPD